MSDDKNQINLDNIAGSLGKKPEAKQEERLEKTPENIDTDKEIPVNVEENKEETITQKLPEDIFSETDKAKPAVLQPKSVEAIEKYNPDASSNHKLIILAIVLFVLVAMIVGVYFGYNYYFKGEKDANVETEEVQTVPVVDSGVEINNTQQANLINNDNQVVSEITPVDINSSKNTAEEIDTDGDGLSDKDEIVRGMNIESNDSDSDGLYDREEVMVYNTDPINPDTDGDGFLDGDEVAAGYNPKGAGKLYDIRSVK